MVEVIDRRRVKAGYVIFKQGDRGDRAFIVQSGTVLLYRDKVLIAELGDGSIFGEMALIDGAPRIATAVVKEGATLIAIPKRMIDAKLEGIDPFVSKLLRILVANVRNTTLRLTGAMPVEIQTDISGITS